MTDLCTSTWCSMICWRWCAGTSALSAVMSSLATANSASSGHANSQSIDELFTMPGKLRHRRLYADTRVACGRRRFTRTTTTTRRTARRDVSAKILHRTNSVGTTCTTTPEQTEGMLLEDYCRPTYNKLSHSVTTRSTVVGAIHKLTVGEFVDHTNTLMPCCGKNFLSPKYRNKLLT